MSPWYGRSSRRDRERNAPGGFTLVEVLVAVALLAFLVLGVMALLTTVVHQNKLAQERSVATALASERISRLMSQPFRAASAYLGYKLPEEVALAGPPSTLTADYGTIPGFPEFRRVVTLSYDVPATGMLRVEAKVYWKDRQQGEKNHEMVTYLHPGLEQGR
jgi:prepilin-type N-terminal cleavage/methylation domain-containing protein